MNIEKVALCTRDDRVVLAVSGGIDSVVMAHLFFRGGYQFAIAHCNFALRGEESDMDEVFVRNLAQGFGVPFFSKRFSTPEYAASKGISIQMAARDLRYAWFEEIRGENNFKYVATAHNSDDHTETFLINIIRGAGLAGLKSIQAAHANIIRPLLSFSREEIAQFAGLNNIAYREDSSNSETKYIRNKIRHQVIPILKGINPSLNQTIGNLAQIAGESLDLIRYFIGRDWEQLVTRRGDETLITIEAVRRYTSPGVVLFELLKDFGFQPGVVADISECLDSQPGKLFYSASHVCLKDRLHLVVSPLDAQVRAKEPVTVEFCQTKAHTIAGTFMFEYLDNFDLERITGIPTELFADLEKLSFPLTLRGPGEGDFFYPFGMSGKKKVSDYLIDKKVARTLKNRLSLLCTGNDIVWVAGLRSDDRFRVKPSTRKVLAVRFVPNDHDLC